MTSDQDSRPKRSGIRVSIQVAVFMSVVALVSMFAVGAFNLVSARDVLDTVVEEQLTDVAASSFAAIDGHFDAMESMAVVLAGEQGVVDALAAFSSAYGELPSAAEPEHDAELLSAYERELSDAPAGDEDPSPGDLMPESPQTLHLQYWYIAQNENDDRSLLDRADDGSAYSDVHAQHHPVLRTIASEAGFGDLILVDLDGVVVYSVDKNIDVGTSLTVGPHRDSVLASAALDVGPNTGVGEAGFTDFDFYAPDRYDPTAFIVSSVSGGDSTIGTLLLEVSADDLTAFVTNDSDWVDAGLGDTGEVYLVGDDLTLRTESRAFLEDPESFVDDTSVENGDRVAQDVAQRQTSVLTQPAASNAVEEALATGSFSGTTFNYLGNESLAVAESIDIAAGQWVLVGEVSSEEAYADLRSYVKLLMILIVILVPLLAIATVLLSRRMLRPIDDLVSVADDVGRGRTDLASPFFGNDEFDDVSRRLNGVIDTMRTQERELEAADAETTELLLAAMPARLAEQVMGGDFSLSQELHDATIAVATVGDTSVVDAVGQDSLADRTVQIAGKLASVARDRGVEVLHSSTTQYVFALGLDVEAPEANKAVAFASDVQHAIGRLAEEFDVDITCRVGLSAGQVIQGIVGSGRVSFTVWGTPLDYATDLSMASAPGEILVDAAVAGRLDPEWSLEPMNELVDLSGGRLDGWRVLGHDLASRT